MARMRVILAMAVALAATTAASAGGAPPVDHGPPNANTVPLSFDPSALAQFNGSATHGDAASICGSSTETYLTELFHTSPANVKVNYEWADIAGTKQVAVQGPVRTTHLGPTDLPLSHLFGDDLSMDVGLTPDLQPFAMHLGPSGEPTDQIHVELASGLIPHQVRPSPWTPALTWRQASDFDLSGFLDDFSKPNVGDPSLVVGRWIIDCGHGDYGAELHPMSFLAWSHTAGPTNTVHAYMNPYADTQLYGPDASVLGHVSDTSRFSDPNVQAFVPYLINETIRVISGQTDRLRAQELLEARNVAPPPFTVCAPAGSHGRLVVNSDVVTRPGVNVDVALDHPTGCARVTITETPGYHPVDQTIHLCQLPWDYLNAIASDAVGSQVDVRALFESVLPPDLAAIVTAHDPIVSCADPLAGPDVSSSPDGQHVRVDATQPFPFYGIITVTRGK
ncbi:MAG TPA: hypothetical protein VFR41_05975 [Acidimicrobiia bacterium]|nr:hypothetical protein [Acidimicrobiia bacterium]